MMLGRVARVARPRQVFGRALAQQGRFGRDLAPRGQARDAGASGMPAFSSSFSSSTLSRRADQKTSTLSRRADQKIAKSSGKRPRAPRLAEQAQASPTQRPPAHKRWLAPDGEHHSGTVPLPPPHTLSAGNSLNDKRKTARVLRKQRTANLPVYSHLSNAQTTVDQAEVPRETGAKAAMDSEQFYARRAEAEAASDAASIRISRSKAAQAKTRARMAPSPPRSNLLGRMNKASSAASRNSEPDAPTGHERRGSRGPSPSNNDFLSLANEVITSSKQGLFATASHEARRLYEETRERAAKNSVPEHKRFLLQELVLLMEVFKAMHESVPAAVKAGNRVSDGQLAARVYPGVVSDFPVATLFEALMLASWWGHAQELVQFMANTVRWSPGAPSDYINTLITMHKSCCMIGYNLPNDKDAIPTALMLNELLGVDQVGRNPLLETVFRRSMRLFVGQFDKHKDPSLLHHVVQLFAEAQQVGVTPSPTMWLWVAQAHGKLGNLEGVDGVLRTLQQNRVPPQPRVVGGILSMYCYNDELGRAEQLLANMNHRVPWEPDVNYEQPFWEWVVNKLQGFSSAGFLEDPMLYGPAAIGQNPDDTKKGSRRRRLPAPREPVASSPDLKTSGLHWPPPTPFMYNMLLHAYVNRKDIDRVHALYTDMKARGIMTNDGTANIIAEAFVDSPYGTDLLRIEHPNLVPNPREYIDDRDLLRDGVLGPRLSAPTVFSTKLDLHSCSRPKAKIAVLAHLEAIANAYVEYERLLQEQNAREASTGDAHSPDCDGDKGTSSAGNKLDNTFIIVTGKGQGDRRSGRRGPVLREFVRRILEERGVPYWLPPLNNGRICVRVSDLKGLANEKEQRARNLETTYRVSSHMALILLGLSSFSALPVLFSYMQT